MTYDPLAPLSPFEKIEAINRIAGRQTGPAPGGYVDENGTPIVPDWSGAGEHQVVGGGLAERSEASEGAVEARATSVGEGGEADAAPAQQAVWNLVMLESGDGVWREQAFTLASSELLRVRRIVVAAIRRGLREQGRVLGAEVAPKRQRKPKGAKRASRPSASGEV